MMSDLTIMAIAFAVQFCLLIVVKIRQHRKTKNTVLAIIDHAWVFEDDGLQRESTIRLRKRIEQMTLADTLNASTKEWKR